MMNSPDHSAFFSRLRLEGRLVFESAVRIGAARSNIVDEPDLPVLRGVDGVPYIPGSSFKGAFRSYIESVLRALQSQPGARDRNLACLSVGKPAARSSNDDGSVCLAQDEVTALKQVEPVRWRTSARLSKLHERLPTQDEIERVAHQGNGQALLDRVLREQSCWTCRLLGAPWLASKLLIRDLALDPDTFHGTEVRDGVAIDRDSGRASTGLKYEFEVIPAGVAFKICLLVENASEAELGLLWLGVAALENSQILIGGAKSRGLGWCRLELERDACRYIAPGALLDALFPTAHAPQPGLTPEQSQAWTQAFLTALGVRAVGGQNAPAATE